MLNKTLNIFGPENIELSAIQQLERVLEDDRAIEGALMADAHLGYSMPIGGVVVYDNAISPTGVGFDIACGNMCVKTDLDINSTGFIYSVEVKKVMRAIQKKVEFGIGGKNRTPIDHELFDYDIWSWIEDNRKGLKQKAHQQLGTVGSGNHYVDLLVDEEGFIWVANHFGSRGLGHTIASGFMALAGGKKFNERVQESEDPIVFNVWDEIGAAYLECMRLAGDYAYAGREYVIQQVLDILGATATFSVHNHHNFAWNEGAGEWVVRKGATPLTTKPAFIGGSMGDISVIVRGLSLEVPSFLSHLREAENSVLDIGALASAPHGAGRVMSRTAAAGKMRKMWVCNNRDCDWMTRAYPGNMRADFDGKQFAKCPKCQGVKFKKIRMRDPETAKIDWGMARADLTKGGIVVLGAGADESPGVYKSLETVLAAHSNIEILHTLQPIGVVMAGSDTYDPYRD